MEWEYRVNGSSILITRIGVQLSTAITDLLITKDSSIEQVEAGLAELHGIGFAHCDLKLDNIFYDESGGCVFLGDLSNSLLHYWMFRHQ